MGSSRLAASAKGTRCRCKPSYRKRYKHPVTGERRWTPAFKDRNDIVTWLGALNKGVDELREKAAAGATFGELGDDWREGVESGSIGKRNGKRTRYSPNTLRGYLRDYDTILRPAFGERVADEIVDIEWQGYVDGLARGGLSRSRIANIIAVASAIYGWAASSRRRKAARNPLRGIELPPADAMPRDRVAPWPEALTLLLALDEERRVPYALAACCGLRREEIHRLIFADLDTVDFAWLVVREAKSRAGEGRRIFLPEALRPLLRKRWKWGVRQNAQAKVSRYSVMSGKLSEQAHKAWGWKRQGDLWVPAVTDPLTPIGLHEMRHTYASFLMAAGYNATEHKGFMGHADLQMTDRYSHPLPPAGGEDPAERLNEYFRREGGGSLL